MNKIPVRKTIAETYRFTFGSLGKIMGLIWLPAVLVAVGSYFCMLPYYDFLASHPADELTQAGGVLVRVYLFYVLSLMLVAMMVVLIAREALTPREGHSYLVLPHGGEVLRVCGSFVGLMALFLTFVLALSLLGTALQYFVVGGLLHGLAGLPKAGIVGLFYFVGLAVILYFMVRLGFLMVPAALHGKSFGIERSWRLTAGNFWRIVLVSLAVMVPVLLVAAAALMAILGPDFFNPHAELVGDDNAVLRLQSLQMRAFAKNFPQLTGLSFFLTPFTYGLSVSSAVFSFRALAEEPAPSPMGAVPPVEMR
jgi:hypothetical protein